MGAASKALGDGFPYEFEGTVYRLAGWTQGVQSDYEMYLESQVLSKARLLRSTMTNEQLADCDPMVLTIRDINCGYYSYGSRAFFTSLQSERHLKRAALIMFAFLPPLSGAGVITPEIVNRMYEADSEGLVNAMLAADRDPNKKAPEASAPGAK